MKTSIIRRMIPGLAVVALVPLASSARAQPSPCDFLPPGGIEGSTYGRGEQRSYGIAQDCQRDFAEPGLYRVYILRYIPAKLDSAYQAMYERDSSDLDRFPYRFDPIPGLGDGRAWERTGLRMNRGSGSITFRRGDHVVVVSYFSVPEALADALPPHIGAVARSVDAALARGAPNGPGASTPPAVGATTSPPERAPPPPPVDPGTPAARGGTSPAPVGSAGVPPASGGGTTPAGGAPLTDDELEVQMRLALAGVDNPAQLRARISTATAESKAAGARAAQVLGSQLIARFGMSAVDLGEGEARALLALQMAVQFAAFQQTDGKALFPSIRPLLPILGKLAEKGAADPDALLTLQRVVAMAIRLDTQPER